MFFHIFPIMMLNHRVVLLLGLIFFVAVIMATEQVPRPRPTVDMPLWTTEAEKERLKSVIDAIQWAPFHTSELTFYNADGSASHWATYHYGGNGYNSYLEIDHRMYPIIDNKPPPPPSSV